MKIFALIGLLGLFLSGCASNGGGYVVGNGLVPANDLNDGSMQKRTVCECAGKKNCACDSANKTKK